MGFFTQNIEIPEKLVLLKAFYKNVEGTLRQINMYDTLSNLENGDVFQNVLSMLHKEQERYFKPILVVVQGGKV